MEAPTAPRQTVTCQVYLQLGTFRIRDGRTPYVCFRIPECADEGRPFALESRPADDWNHPDEWCKAKHASLFFQYDCGGDQPTHTTEVREIEVPRAAVDAIYRAYERKEELARLRRVVHEEMREAQRAIDALVPKADELKTRALTERERLVQRDLIRQEAASREERFLARHGVTRQDLTPEQIDALYEADSAPPSP